GLAGPPGQSITGPAGYSPRWIVGTAAPTPQTGNDGDMYLKSDTSDVYGPKAGTWPGPIANIRGLRGIDGAPGASVTGPPGKDAVMPPGNQIGDVQTWNGTQWLPQQPAAAVVGTAAA